MRVTITKTIEIDEIPSEIDEAYEAMTKRLDSAQSVMRFAASNAKEGRYIDASEAVEELRQILVMLDKNLEEQQSLCLSFEKLRISKQMPEQQHAQTSPMVEAPSDE